MTKTFCILSIIAGILCWEMTADASKILVFDSTTYAYGIVYTKQPVAKEVSAIVKKLEALRFEITCYDDYGYTTCYAWKEDMQGRFIGGWIDFELLDIGVLFIGFDFTFEAQDLNALIKYDEILKVLKGIGAAIK